MIDFFALAGAAFLAGVLNAIAGGGTFLTLPALVYAGISPVAANATSTIVVCPGYVGATLGFLPELRTVDHGDIVRTVAASVAGALIGSCLLVITPDNAFNVIVPFLLLAATVVFALESSLRDWLTSQSLSFTPYGAAGTFAVSVYGGYFNGGLGIVLLALFALWGMTEINVMNSLKNVLSIAISIISLLTFAAAGLVAWPEGLLMMVAAIAGGYCGAPLSRALPTQVIRAIVIVTGTTMSLIFFARLL
ncbi:hypothetical protein A7A08_03013 [Methyloligella halotolerans]|uniref:Probable membrane transporter protein n=1 Tax=Methyloligella halotolerans TaxID=1177755 RepID=A0A1E2RVL2_9HYPH|nr:sulfite exporter TauE/SafE family protein [Methyloligella halotolerans]ODA66160.1 hypothetical protein A7A08_03013 [Methyloligella halotolerans]